MKEQFSSRVAALLLFVAFTGSAIAFVVVCAVPALAWQVPGYYGGAYLGNLSVNPHDPNSISNPYGAGSPHNPNGIFNRYGPYGSPYSPRSWTNPYATEAPLLFDGQGAYRGTLSVNPNSRDSISNPYGRYGSPYSPPSINNPYGGGNRYAPDSPFNPYGRGWPIIGR
jgi:hypothetical protein